MKYLVTCGERTIEVEVEERSGRLEVAIEGRATDLTYQEVDRLGQVLVQYAGETFGMSIEGDEHHAFVTLAGHGYPLELEDERERAAGLAARAAGAGGGPVKSVMPGVVAAVLVAVGDEVRAGQALLVLEAMKMQNEIAAPGDGVVAGLSVAAGQAVGAGEVLVTLSAPPEG